jgi:hypothetical protein
MKAMALFLSLSLYLLLLDLRAQVGKPIAFLLQSP